MKVSCLAESTRLLMARTGRQLGKHGVSRNDRRTQNG